MTELAAIAIVLVLVAGAAALARRGVFRRFTSGGAIVVETAVTLGERRSLVIVSVEGRRLLLGLTPTTMSLVTELGTAQPVPAEPA